MSNKKIIRIIAIAVLLGFFLLIITALSSCAGLNNNIQKSGSLFGPTEGDYIVVNYSGGKIIDVWKLKDKYVQSESGSDGWNFIDSTGNVIMLGGDTKVIRVKDSEMFGKYQEYHYEFDGREYYEFASEARE